MESALASQEGQPDEGLASSETLRNFYEYVAEFFERTGVENIYLETNSGGCRLGWYEDLLAVQTYSAFEFGTITHGSDYCHKTSSGSTTRNNWWISDTGSAEGYTTTDGYNSASFCDTRYDSSRARLKDPPRVEFLGWILEKILRTISQLVP